MKPTTTSILALRPASSLVASSSIVPFFLSRTYATQNSLGATAAPRPRKRKVTPFNDDGAVPWNQLSGGEKAARATQQSFNFGLVLVGIVLTVSGPHDGIVSQECSCRWAHRNGIGGLTFDHRAVSRISYGLMCSLRIAKLPTSTGPSTKSRRTLGAWIS